MLDVVLEARAKGVKTESRLVSILVVLDVVLEVATKIIPDVQQLGFNPCCAGCSSGSRNVIGWRPI